MAVDGSIKIGTEIDQSGLDKGLKGVESKLEGGAKSASKFSGGLLGAAAAGAAAAVAVKKAVEVVKDLTDAYKVQAKAETQLESAAKNNPFLDGSSVQALKDYASELQGISTTGDEELLPMMAQLAAAGRTQDEIMQIMSTALDISATGTMSLDSAMRQLNKSYGGFAGELGESIPEIKALSSEELKQGGAVKLLAARYKGMAAEVAATTGTAEQLANAMGDLKEELGAPFEKALGPMRTFFKELVGGWADAMKKRREYEESKETNEAGNATIVTIEKQLEGEKEKLATQKEQLSAITAIAGKSDSELRAMRMTRESIEKQVSAATARVRAQEGIVAGLEEELKIMKDADSAASAVAEKEASGEAKRATAAKREKEAADYINANTKAREDAIAALELQAKAEGRNVENSELLAIYQKSYVDLVSQSNGLVTTSNQAAKTLLDTTLGLLTAEEGITDEKEAQEKADEQLTELQSALGEIQRELTDSDALRQQMSALDEYYAQVIDNELITAEEKEKIAKEYAEKKAILEDQITATEKAAQQERIASYFEAVNTFATQYASIMSSISDLASQMIEDQATIKTAELEEQYSAGEISAEEYEKKLTEIEKEAAEKKYKIAMWEWSSQILTAVANTAQGATKALAQGGYLGLITAALVTAAGGAQLATIIANKPIKPTFATGGIVPGTSYTGDRVEALVNSGEMILNSAQQKRLFDSLNGGSAAGGSRIQVYNSAANDVRVEPQITEDGIRIMIRKTVAKDTADGRFNSASRIAQTTQRGTRYTN